MIFSRDQERVTLNLSHPACAALEVSILIPCLDEAETITSVVTKALASLRIHHLVGEVVVADNGSTDGSPDLAISAGAKVITVPTRGYGAAILGGLQAAQGKFIILGDADASYDFTNIMPFVQKLRDGVDLVMGSRFKGQIYPGAMPHLHRWFGTPLLTALGNVCFNTHLTDYQCGLRGFNAETARSLQLHTIGMEFATELIAAMALSHRIIAEVPITYYPAGRSRRPHLRTWRDGWRHLRVMLRLCPLAESLTLRMPFLGGTRRVYESRKFFV